MGGGTYCFASRTANAFAMGYDTKPIEQIFENRHLIKEMNPYGVTLREARDSEEHPNSFPIILALDVTGSMGFIPYWLVKTGFPALMNKIITAGIKDPQLLFMGIGDHINDQAPLQIGQFESSDEKLDYWLTNLWLEGKGGGNDGESYLLAWLFASRYTFTDQFEKRKKKGILITIGDEPTLKNLPSYYQKKILGTGQFSDVSASELLNEVRKKYEVYHLHMLEGLNGEKKSVQNDWKELMGENVIFVKDQEDVAQIIADLVIKNQGIISIDKKIEDMEML